MKKLILPLIALSLTTMVGCKADVSKKVELVVYEYGSVDSLILSNGNGRVELPFETVAEYNTVYDKNGVIKKAFKKADTFTKVETIEPKTDRCFTFLSMYLKKIENNTAYYLNGEMKVYADGYLELKFDNIDYTYTVDTFYYAVDPSITEEACTSAEQIINKAKQDEEDFVRFASMENIFLISNNKKWPCSSVVYPDGSGSAGSGIFKNDTGDIFNKIKEGVYTETDGENETSVKLKVWNERCPYILYDYSPEKDSCIKDNDSVIYSFRVEVFENGYATFRVYGHDKSDRLYWLTKFFTIDAAKAKEIVDYGR